MSLSKLLLAVIITGMLGLTISGCAPVYHSHETIYDTAPFPQGWNE